MAIQKISTGTLGDDSVTAAQIAPGTIVDTDIGNNAVTTVKILDANVTTAKIADDAVTAAKLNVTGDGTLGQALTSDADGSMTWATISGASAGGAIYENLNSISADFTFGTNKNGMSVGPITIAATKTVTIPAGQRWVIL